MPFWLLDLYIVTFTKNLSICNIYVYIFYIYIYYAFIYIYIYIYAYIFVKGINLIP